MESAATVVLYPFSEMSHLVSMMELAKLIHLHSPSLSIVVFITPAPFNNNSAENFINTVSATTPFITFHRFPTVPLPPDFSYDFMDRAFGIPELYNPIVHDTLVTISQQSTIKAVILDFFSNAAFRVSRSLNFPTYYFYTSGASPLCEFLYFPTIHHTTSKKTIDFDIPGVPSIHVSDMPPVMLDRETNAYKKFMDTASDMAKSSGLIVNSFEGLEERAVDALRNGKCTTDGPTPPVYLIGPLLGSRNQPYPSENECLKWLNTQPSKSVVFLCFGSMGVFGKHQLRETAIGLMKSGQRFLWVVRNPPPENDNDADAKDLGLEAIFPEGFLAKTADKGLVVKNWAPQPAILGHDSVGGFVTHCGWNSTLEAVVAGVPMVAWPLYAEQKMNKVFLVEEMKVAIAVKMSGDGLVAAEEVEKKVKDLMVGEEGRAVRDRVLEMSRRAKAAVGEGGSSQVDLFKLTKSLLDI